jgi:hypothetical protein
MFLDWYKRRLQIFETGGEWLVERNGVPVARLFDPQYADMFWVSWVVHPVTDDPTECAGVMSAEFWAPEFDSVTEYRSCEFGSVASNAFPTGIPFVNEPGRLEMRGMYPPCSGPWPWDRLVMWLLKRFSTSH